MGNVLAQGDLAPLDTAIAQDLLISRIPARRAYTWLDGTPRVVPIYFHWTGDEMVFGSLPEYAAAMKRCLGEEAGSTFVASVDQPGVQMARLALASHLGRHARLRHAPPVGPWWPIG